MCVYSTCAVRYWQSGNTQRKEPATVSMQSCKSCLQLCKQVIKTSLFDRASSWLPLLLQSTRRAWVPACNAGRGAAARQGPAAGAAAANGLLTLPGVCPTVRAALCSPWHPSRGAAAEGMARHVAPLAPQQALAAWALGTQGEAAPHHGPAAVSRAHRPHPAAVAATPVQATAAPQLLPGAQRCMVLMQPQWVEVQL